MDQKTFNRWLQEDRVFRRRAQFSDRAALKAGELLGMYAKRVTTMSVFGKDPGHSPKSTGIGTFAATLDEAQGSHYPMVTDGQLNVSHNCLDVHLRERGTKTAIVSKVSRW